MGVKSVNLLVSQIIDDLNQGRSWLKKDDLGYGSIEEKYGANPIQIKAIMNHPKLKGREPEATVFTLIDDTEEKISPVVKSNDVTISQKVEEKIIMKDPISNPIKKDTKQAINRFKNL